MSDSRLEKFIYAICSMDVTDLPVPLSRIEKLWNCLITGETPDFEPLSRNEKYLMAMLDRYDISNLPAPMSRGEKLLYKIAIGETDLSDVPGYLSRYEELLKYLIENGGISGGDFEYVLYTFNQSLYTLYTTAEKPVKSAILSGNTLVNLATENSVQFTTASDWKHLKTKQKMLNTTKNYMVKFNSSHDYKGYVHLRDKATNTYITDARRNNFKKGSNVVLLGRFLESDLESFSNIYITFFSDSGSATNLTITDVMLIEYQEGMENWDIPYFEGMQSVKMPVLSTIGKNLFDGKFTKYEGVYGYYYLNNGTYTCSITDNDTSVDVSNLSFGVRDTGIIWFFDEGTMYNTKRTITNGKLIFYPNTEEAFNKIKQRYHIQIEEGTVATPYEPYKSNILTVPSDLELRGIGEVQDTLDCLTGEVIERIGEIVLDGSENWQEYYSGRYYLNNVLNNVKRPKNDIINIKCDKLKPITYSDEYYGATGISIYDKGDYDFIVRSDIKTVEEFKEWLLNNQTTVQYQLATESIKTVDLTTVDQDNQPTQLGTFENITHVSLESAGLIPEVEMEVATNLLEDTVFNLTDAFNTLYPTAAKPVVDGTLYGQTLANVATQKSGRFNGTRFLRIPLSYTLKSNTNYFVNFIVKESTLTDGVTCRFKNTSTGITLGALKSSGIITTNANVADILEIYIDNTDDVANGLDAIIDDIMVIEYQDGMENWDIPYFEGMQSVKIPVLTTTGSNMVNPADIKVIGCNSYDVDSDGIANIVGDTTEYWAGSYINYMHHLKANTTYYIYCDGDSTGRIIAEGWVDNSNAGKISWNNFYKYTPETDVLYTAKIFLNTSGSPFTCSKIRIGIFESTTKPSSYEPYKSNILSTPEDLELRGIGEVQDELNLLTGEISNNFNKITIDGTENWNKSSNETELTVRYRCNDIGVSILKKNICICDSYNVDGNTVGDILSVDFSGTMLTYRVLKSKFPTLEDFKKWLNDNPHTFIYQTEKSIKTVDLTVVNQDGNETKLRTFDDTTHVLLNSEGLIPTASLTVRTKIPSASSTSLLMDDISTEQEQLNTTVNEQSENVDATMIATTEIFEETL